MPIPNINFKNWLLNEDLNFFDNLTPEKYMQMLMSDPKGQELINDIKTSQSPMSLMNLLEDPLKLYEKATKKNVDPNDEKKYKQQIQSEFIPFLNDLQSKQLLSLSPGDPWFHFDANIRNPAVQQKIIPDELKNQPLNKQIEFFKNDKTGGFRDSDKKIYFSFDNANPNAIQALKAMTNYFAENPELFRQAKFPISADRTESFIFYLSKIGDQKEQKIQNDVSQILNDLKLQATTKVKKDLGTQSGNQIEVSQLNIKALLHLVPKITLEKFANQIKNAFNFNKQDMSNFKKTKIYPVYQIIQNDPQLKKILSNQGINIDLNNQNQPTTTKNEQPITNQGNGNLTLTPKETNKPLPVKIDASIGNGIIQTPTSQRFMSQKQFILKKVNGAWTITQSPDAKNITNINGKPLTEPTILNNGDTISLGKSGQVPIKVNFN
jgi:hypothetical protein